MAIIAINLGDQVKTHCSTTSSINKCDFLRFNIMRTKCKLFDADLGYDYDEHAYQRCIACLEAEMMMNKMIGG